MIKKNMSSLGVKMSIHTPKTLPTHYAPKDSWWPTSTPMMPKSNGKLCRPVPTALISWALPRCCSTCEQNAPRLKTAFTGIYERWRDIAKSWWG